MGRLNMQAHRNNKTIRNQKCPRDTKLGPLSQTHLFLYLLPLGSDRKTASIKTLWDYFSKLKGKIWHDKRNHISNVIRIRFILNIHQNNIYQINAAWRFSGKLFDNPLSGHLFFRGGGRFCKNEPFSRSTGTNKKDDAKMSYRPS